MIQTAVKMRNKKKGFRTVYVRSIKKLPDERDLRAGKAEKQFTKAPEPIGKKVRKAKFANEENAK